MSEPGKEPGGGDGAAGMAARETKGSGERKHAQQRGQQLRRPADAYELPEGGQLAELAPPGVVDQEARTFNDEIERGQRQADIADQDSGIVTAAAAGMTDMEEDENDG